LADNGDILVGVFNFLADLDCRFLFHLFCKWDASTCAAIASIDDVYVGSGVDLPPFVVDDVSSFLECGGDGRAAICNASTKAGDNARDLGENDDESLDAVSAHSLNALSGVMGTVFGVLLALLALRIGVVYSYEL